MSRDSGTATAAQVALEMREFDASLDLLDHAAAGSLGIGRTDLWGGDTNRILASIRERLFPLPGDTTVVCGHGPDTTIEEEKRLNPFAGL